MAPPGRGPQPGACRGGDGRARRRACPAGPGRARGVRAHRHRAGHEPGPPRPRRWPVATATDPGPCAWVQLTAVDDGPGRRRRRRGAGRRLLDRELPRRRPGRVPPGGRGVRHVRRAGHRDGRRRAGGGRKPLPAASALCAASAPSAPAVPGVPAVPPGAAPAIRVGGILSARPGERESADGWGTWWGAEGLTLIWRDAAARAGDATRADDTAVVVVAGAAPETRS